MAENNLQKKQYRSELYLLMVTVIWGGTFAVTKSGLEDASPLLFLGIRCSVAALLFAGLFFRRLKKHIAGSLRAGLLLGLLMYLGLGLQTVGLAHTTASRSGFITYVYALIVPFLQVFFLKKRPAAGSIIGLLTVITGLYILTNPGGGPIMIGDFLTLGSAIAYAFYITFLNTHTRGRDVIVLTGMQFAVTGALALVTSPLIESPFLRVTPNLLWGIAYLALLGSMLATYVMTRFQKHTTPVRATLIYAMEPIVAVIIASLLLNETFSGAEWAGAALIVSGVLISEFWGLLMGRRRH